MKYLAAVMLLLTSCACSEEIVEPAPIGQEVCREMQLEFTEMDCTNLKEPEIIVTWLVDMVVLYGSGLNGIYFVGEPYVFINRDSEDFIGTMYHEVSHYVAFETGLKLNRCAMERVARGIAHQPWTERERAVYRCTEDDKVIPTVKLSP